MASWASWGDKGAASAAGAASASSGRSGGNSSGRAAWGAPSSSSDGWPLAEPVRLGRVEMTNLIGAEADDYARYLTLPGASLHLYGKGEARPGRKMGHVTRVQPES